MVATQRMQRSGPPQQSGIRPFDLGRDIRAVADLIADAFRAELDDRGAAALREVRTLGRLSGLIRLLNLTGSELDGFFGGFVWLEEGRVVGNVTVQKADKAGSRWQIANVAVAEAWRGRGISRRLMERAIEHVAENGGRWATLQVYAANRVARTLYSHLGFEEVGGLTELEAKRLPPLPTGTGRSPAATGPAPVPGAPISLEDEALAAAFRPFGRSDWQPLFDLANNQLGAAAQWWRPLRRADFEPTLEVAAGELLWQALGRRQIFRRCVQRSPRAQRFEAALVLTAQRWSGAHRVQLWVRPEHYGQVERPLVQWALQTLRAYPTLPIQASVPSDHLAALEALQAAGFRAQRTLLTMRLDLAPDSPASGSPAPEADPPAPPYGSGTPYGGGTPYGSGTEGPGPRPLAWG